MAPPRKSRPGFSRRAQFGLFLGYVAAVVGALVGAVLIALSFLHPPAYIAARGILREATTPVSTGLHWARRRVADIPPGVGGYFGVMGENRRLKAEREAEKQLVERARGLVIENIRLRRLLQLRDREAETVAMARLVNATSASTRRFATLNAGLWQGVRAGYPVRGPEGLIGRVLEVSPNTARVLLAVDPESIIPVRRVRDGMPAIATGRGDGLIQVRVAGIANMPYRTGDVFVTSGAGGLYPPGIPVARVLGNARDTAAARPLANPDALDFALVQRPYLLPPARPEAAPK
ncbi:rod shape-determining protein MreC [Sphingomonas spermidinifaciens]|uniref:Cell shape-determining protein MreC n=1 Tax=Sphingomonas spermidinifaciens TaxID=1141889 RepID=A0A2A4B5F1_9SPHN|nr:rod shape-determining protein MreC [Sphingomonas spermidinifaciens]PCD02968.1 rod shape-determining protein MreC [Sphingomonas spermidinifaciens]